MFKSVLVAVDGSDHARKALRIAADIADLYKTPLTVLHVVTGEQVGDELRHMAEVEQLIKPAGKPLPTPGNLPAELGTLLNTTALQDTIGRVATAVGQRILDDAVGETRAAKKIDVHAVLEHGDPAQVILACAKSISADLVVLGSRGLSNIAGVFQGSVSTKVSHATGATCLTVK